MLLRLNDTHAMSERKTYPDIAERLGTLRAGFSEDNRSVWAGRHGFNVSQYINWENGTRRIPLEAAEKLVQRYGVTLDWIYLGRWDGLSDSARKTLSSASQN